MLYIDQRFPLTSPSVSELPPAPPSSLHPHTSDFHPDPPECPSPLPGSWTACCVKLTGGGEGIFIFIWQSGILEIEIKLKSWRTGENTWQQIFPWGNVHICSCTILLSNTEKELWREIAWVYQLSWRSRSISGPQMAFGCRGEQEKEIERVTWKWECERIFFNYHILGNDTKACCICYEQLIQISQTSLHSSLIQLKISHSHKTVIMHRGL